MLSVYVQFSGMLGLGLGLKAKMFGRGLEAHGLRLADRGLGFAIQAFALQGMGFSSMLYVNFLQKTINHFIMAHIPRNDRQTSVRSFYFTNRALSLHTVLYVMI